MSKISIKIDEGSTYSIELNDEYTPEEFISTFESFIKVISLIISNNNRLQRDMNLSWGLDILSSKVDHLETEIKKSVDRMTALVLTDDSSILPGKD
jgi:hypothetical protein